MSFTRPNDIFQLLRQLRKQQTQNKSVTTTMRNILKIPLLLILIVSTQMLGQRSDMPSNENYFVADRSSNTQIKKKFRSLRNKENKLEILVERGSDFHYSIYIRNNSKEVISVNTQDQALFLIQEAKVENGDWLPAEYWVMSSCGNSYYSKEIRPNHILQWDSKGYNGYRQTEIRFKVLINDTVYYSNSIRGNVKPNQIIIPPDIAKVWPLRVSRDSIPQQLIEDVVFLEPNGNHRFMEFLEKSWAKK